MKKTFIFLSAVILLNITLFAQEGGKSGWELELKRISLNLTSTSVQHAQRYGGFADSRLSADGQTLIQGYGNLFAGYYAEMFLWSNNLVAEYGRTEIRPADGSPATKSENVDRITITTDLAYRLWEIEDFLGGFEAGPFANLEYQTEFTTASSGHRKQVGRARGGAKLFKGKYIREFYLAGVLEEDFTITPYSTNFAWETGLRLEHELRDGVKALFDAYFRDYVYRSDERNIDLDYEIGIEARMDVLVYKNLSVAPFINWYAAQATNFGGLGQNLFVGVSFSFSRLFIAAGK
ncbi:hypothetical protein Emin_0238 [Elusimicrobium minutum Pei191]|uniref:DUF3078 domain-containing protein n=1 Tax=Elusimicrobium minutum (strain Pei191) TaxID=445932 RepID=B2KB41_ELUMP|nr:hypothetical protein [Elusimicrobium minutum]ACC97800.1 hypothetical protein Emin_0238 [Elusimicrobium minutum Pei191]